MCLSLQPGVPKKKLLLLWQHECHWVYGHRMVNEVDFKRFRQTFVVSVKKEFADDEQVSKTKFAVKLLLILCILDSL